MTPTPTPNRPAAKKRATNRATNRGGPRLGGPRPATDQTTTDQTTTDQTTTDQTTTDQTTTDQTTDQTDPHPADPHPANPHPANPHPAGSRAAADRGDRPPGKPPEGGAAGGRRSTRPSAELPPDRGAAPEPGDPPAGRPAERGAAAGPGDASAGKPAERGAAGNVRAGGPAYRRSAGSARGEARRRDLLDRVADDLAANGLVDFSLRRAARAAGTTHKVLLYYFDGADDLLVQAILKLRDRRIDRGLAAAARDPGRPLSARVRDLWPALVAEEGHVLDQAIGLSMYDPTRYAALGHGASQQYLPALLSLLPDTWPERRRLEVAELILGALRGFLIDRLTSGTTAGVEAGLDALARALDREEAIDKV
jgi:AcrR family transcriptional regulator